MEDYQGHPIHVGDTVTYIKIPLFPSRIPELRTGIIIGLSPNPAMSLAVQVIDTTDPGIPTTLIPLQHIAYLDKKYRGISVEFLGGLFGRQAEVIK